MTKDLKVPIIKDVVREHYNEIDIEICSFL